MVSVSTFVIRDGLGGSSLRVGGVIREVWFGSRRSFVGTCANQTPFP